MTAKKTEKAQAPSGGLRLVKAIKNTLFKGVPIGGSAIVAGTIREISDEEGTYGAYVAFSGDFGAVVEGQTYKAGKMFLPEVAANVLKNGFLGVLEHATEGVPVSIEFKLKLAKIKDDTETNQNGFTWAAEPLLDPRPQDDKVLQLLG